MPTKTKAMSLFKPGGRQHILEGRYVVQGVPITLEHSDACYRQDVVQVRLPSSSRENWGEDIKLPNDIHVISVIELDEAVLGFFNRWPDALVPCPNCGAMTWNRKHFRSKYRDERCSDCWFAEFDSQCNRWKAEDDDTLRKQDIAKYHEGMRYRVSCLVYPGEDHFVVDTYHASKPNEVEVAATMREKYPRAVRIEVGHPVQLPSH